MVKKLVWVQAELAQKGSCLSLFFLIQMFYISWILITVRVFFYSYLFHVKRYLKCKGCISCFPGKIKDKISEVVTMLTLTQLCHDFFPPFMGKYI